MMEKVAQTTEIQASGARLSTEDCHSGFLFAAAILSVSLIVVLLLRFPPEQYAFLYPQCPIYHYFGILCAGCGTTRALAALLRGHLLTALQWNALTTLNLPIVAGWILFTRKPLRGPQISPKILYSVLVVSILFTIARNL